LGLLPRSTERYDGHLGIGHADSMRFAAATANLAQATWDTYFETRDVSNGSVTDGHEFDWVTPDVRAPFGRGR